MRSTRRFYLAPSGVFGEAFINCSAFRYFPTTSETVCATLSFLPTWCWSILTATKVKCCHWASKDDLLVAGAHLDDDTNIEAASNPLIWWQNNTFDLRTQAHVVPDQILY